METREQEPCSTRSWPSILPGRPGSTAPPPRSRHGSERRGHGRAWPPRPPL